MPSQIPRGPVEIERESNRRKLESFRAIKSDLIFNKFPLGPWWWAGSPFGGWSIAAVHTGGSGERGGKSRDGGR